MAQPRLIAFTCPKCHQHLADLPPGSSVWCKRCRVWVTAQESRPDDPGRV